MDLGPSNSQVLRPPTTSGMSNGGVGSSIESPRSLWAREFVCLKLLRRLVYLEATTGTRVCLKVGDHSVFRFRMVSGSYLGIRFSAFRF